MSKQKATADAKPKAKSTKSAIAAKAPVTPAASKNGVVAPKVNGTTKVMKGVKTFKRVLIANRGEIAVRVARTLRDMDIMPIAVYSDADRGALHVRACEFAMHLGPAPARESYLDIDKVLAAAKKAKADAIHPGYGFLSENAGFAQAVADAGITFIGPPPAAMRTMGSKTGAREAMKKAGVPVVPGSDGAIPTEEAARKFADSIGYPVMLKASAGGGGKGMRAVYKAEDLASAYRAARSEAKSAFGDDSVYIEKVIVRPRHVEIQIFGGPDGKCVWLGERECSMQRRHQKVIEETPSMAIDETIRRKMGEVACRAGDAVNYVGAGTCEFLVDASGAFYFLEMNTRLQVEHPVTELCCGLDLVEAQVKTAQGMPLAFTQDSIRRSGHAIEARIYAEDADRNFMPAPGHISELVLPHGPGVRVDCGVSSNSEVTRFYDPMIAKVTVWAEDRERARRRLQRALSETAVKGVITNGAFLRRLLDHPDFIKGDYHTGTIAEMMAAPAVKVPSELVDVAVVAAVVNNFRRDARSLTPGGQGTSRSQGWRQAAWRGGGG